ncbi:MAG TPA: hypothetical protein PKO44_02260 [Candidatus Omnitrophota bacterium]|nr:hypothetical protein [Candidatus Omnitrophota bacterium]
MTREELVDKLTRAYEMEEMMASMLLEIVAQLLSQADIPAQQKSKAKELFFSIQSDTLTHKKTIAKVIEQLSQGEYHV